MLRKYAIAVFVAVHILVGIVAAFFAGDHPDFLFACFIALVFCQTSLVGMWSGLAVVHWAWRLLGVLVGSIYLFFLFGMGIDALHENIFFLVMLSTFAVAGGTWGVRLLKSTVIRLYDPNQIATKENLQFTIWQLMMFTFAIACLLTIGKQLVPFFDDIFFWDFLASLSLCFITVALTSIWAMLGTGSPILRSIIVLTIAAISGGALGFFYENDFFFWTSIMIMQALLLIGSLGVLRYLGYRLLGKTADKTSAEVD